MQIILKRFSKRSHSLRFKTLVEDIDGFHFYLGTRAVRSGEASTGISPRPRRNLKSSGIFHVVFNWPFRNFKRSRPEITTTRSTNHIQAVLARKQHHSNRHHPHLTNFTDLGERQTEVNFRNAIWRHCVRSTETAIICDLGITSS